MAPLVNTSIQFHISPSSLFPCFTGFTYTNSKDPCVYSSKTWPSPSSLTRGHLLLISDLCAFQMVHYWTRVYWILKPCKLSFFNSTVKNIHKHRYFLKGFHPWEPAKRSRTSIQALPLSSLWTHKKSTHWNALQQMSGRLQEQNPGSSLAFYHLIALKHH